MELLDADWLTEGPIRLNETLSLSDLSGSRVNQRYYRATPRDGVAPIGEPGEKQREGLRGGREGGVTRISPAQARKAPRQAS